MQAVSIEHKVSNNGNGYWLVKTPHFTKRYERDLSKSWVRDEADTVKAFVTEKKWDGMWVRGSISNDVNVFCRVLGVDGYMANEISLLQDAFFVKPE